MKDKDDSSENKNPEAEKVIRDYGVFGRIETIDLSHLNNEIEYLIYAQVASK